MDIPIYLERIHYHLPVQVDARTLIGLHRAHMFSVPFENLDILPLMRPIKLDEASLWEKLVLQGRGGFCYELNGLFAALLQAVGFGVTYLNARVYNHQGELGIPFDHLALLVKIPGESGRWLADVGFGDSFTDPLRFDTSVVQVQGLRAYRLDVSGGGFTVSQRGYVGDWSREYFFDLIPRSFPQDYEAACQYHQTSPRSSFTRSSIISRATPEGRVSLEDDYLIVTEDGKRKERPLQQGEYPLLLKQHFGLVL